MIKIVNGYYGSGKSTFCQSLKGFKHYQLDKYITSGISLDEYIYRILNDYLSNKNNNIAIDFYFKPSYIHHLNNIIDFCKSNNIEYEVIFIKTSLEESFKRYLKRENLNITFEKYKEICEINYI